MLNRCFTLQPPTFFWLKESLSTSVERLKGYLQAKIHDVTELYQSVSLFLPLWTRY